MENPRPGVTPDREPLIVALEAKIDTWGKEDGEFAQIDRRTRILGALLGVSLDENDRLRDLTDIVSAESWDGEPSDNMVAFLKLLSKEDGFSVGALNKRLDLGSRKMTDKKLAEKLDKQGLTIDGDPIAIKLALYVIRRLGADGKLNADGAKQIRANFGKRAQFWEASKAGIKPEEIRGLKHDKWDPAPMSVTEIEKFVDGVMMYSGE